jgi:aspartate/methionine/tyrosine aminotransferase
MFSRRSAFDVRPNRLSEALAARRARRAAVLDLTVSNPTTAELPYDADAIVSALASRASLVYAPLPFGLPDAREAVARDQRAAGVPIDAERIVLTASTSEAYAFLFKLLCDPGDDVLVPAPSYPLFEMLATLEGVRIVPYPLAYDGAWHIDIGAVRSARTPRTKAIVVVTPNNPTGSYLKRHELTALLGERLPVLSDEVFARYRLAEDPTSEAATTVLEADSGLVFALSGLSKLAALPQMKAAWLQVGGDAQLVGDALARLEVIADTFLSVSTPIQHALPELLASRTAVETATLARVRGNLSRLDAALGQAPTPVSRLHVEGGWYATLRIPRVRSDEDWAVGLLEQEGVYVHPGHFFDFPRDGHLVVSLLTRPAVLDEGIAKILRYVEAGCG